MNNNQIYLREAGVNTTILNVIKEHLMNPEVLNVAILTLFSLSLDENNRSILIYNGGCETIIDVIEYHKSNIRIFDPALLITSDCVEVFRKLQTPAAPHSGQALLGAAELSSEQSENSLSKYDELFKNCCTVLILFLNNEDGVLCIKRKLSTLNHEDKTMITNMIKNICNEES
jgi:hypothetical protein